MLNPFSWKWLGGGRVFFRGGAVLLTGVLLGLSALGCENNINTGERDCFPDSGDEENLEKTQLGILQDRTTICLGAPSSGAERAREYIRLNWEEEDYHFVRVLITAKPARVYVENRSKFPKYRLDIPAEEILALWSSTSEDQGVPGYLSLDYLYVPGSDKEPFRFELDTDYYWTVLGYSRWGDLTHSSDSWSFRLFE